MSHYASDCTSLTSLGVPDTSGFSSVGSSFMRSYADSCTSLTSLGVPDTSGITSVGSNFMYYYAGSTSGLLELLLPNAGYFLSNNVDWKVPSGRLGYLKGRVLDVGDLSDWRGLTTSGDTLYTNYIRSSSDVFYTVDNSITKSAGYIVLRNSTLTKSAGYEVTSVDIKKSIYVKVYDSDGTTYIGTWAKDISSDNQISFRQEINQAGSETTISLARSADNFGEGEDIAHGNRVEIYVVDKEAPLGIVIFTGTITRYEVDYGVNKVTVIIRGYGEQLANRIMEDGSGKTKVSHLSKDPSDIFRDILDEYSGDITYDGSSIDDTSTAVSYTFNTNTVKEGIDKALELAPQNWYYYIDQATNLLHFHELASTPDHIFTIGKDTTVLTVSKDMSKVVNTVYFAGGGGPPILYKKYTIPTSIANYGVRALSHKDSRVTLESTADIFAARLLQGSPEILITVAVIDSNLNDLGYDLESIKVGDTVQVMGAGVSVSSRYDSAEYDTSPYDYDLSNVSSILFQITELGV